MATFSRNHFFLLVAVRGSKPALGSFYANPKLFYSLNFLHIFVHISKWSEFTTLEQSNDHIVQT